MTRLIQVDPKDPRATQVTDGRIKRQTLKDIRDNAETDPTDDDLETDEETARVAPE